MKMQMNEIRIAVFSFICQADKRKKHLSNLCAGQFFMQPESYYQDKSTD